MAKIKLTKSAVDAAQPQDKAIELRDTVNQVGQKVTRRNLNTQPTLTNRPGLPVCIIVNRDLVLRPYQPLFFNKGTSR